jgi:hypothetical protein
MADRRSKGPDPTKSRPASTGGPNREARLAEALRRNLRRRKAQRDARAANPEAGDTGPDDETT